MADNVIVRVPEQQFIRGEDGYSPEVTIEDITHGHRVTITDAEHLVEGQSFDVMDGDSAYEQAVAGGYTGTEAQFNEELRSFKALSDETKEAAPFYAEYGVTTKAEIETAINGKRQIYVHSALGMDYAPLVCTFLYLPMFGNVPQTGYRFATIEGTTQYIYDLRDEWSTSENDLSAPADRAEQAADQALIRMNSADASAQDAEAYAIGKRKGIDVGAGDPASNNNSKYYMELAAHCMVEASSSETMAASSMRNARNYASSAQDYAGQATSSASDAAAAKTAAEAAQGLAESAQTAAETAQGKAEDAQEAAEAVLASIPSDYTTLTEDVDDLKSACDIGSYIWGMIRTYPNRDLSISNRTFSVEGKKVSSAGVSGTSGGSYYSINLTGSTMRARNGATGSFTVNDDEFVDCSLLAPNTENVSLYMKLLFLKRPTVDFTSNIGFVMLFRKDGEGNINREIVINLGNKQNTILNLSTALAGYDKFALYYMRCYTQPDRDTSIVLDFDLEHNYEALSL